MISVIIPLYNQADKVIKTLAGLEAQTVQDFEVIIVNDGSTDNPEEKIGQYLRQADPERRYAILNQTNQGAPAARNRGLREARGEYLFFCDADAVLVPQAFEELMNALHDNPSASYAYSSFLWGKKLFRVGNCDAARLKSGPCIHTMALIRRTDFPSVGWDENIKKLQDWDLWLTMLEAGKTGVFVPEVLFTVAPGGTISSWLPSFAYKMLPFLPKVKKYKEAVAKIKEKHGLA